MLSGTAATSAGLALTMCKGQAIDEPEPGKRTQGGETTGVPGKFAIISHAGWLGSGSACFSWFAFKRTRVMIEASQFTTGVTPERLGEQ